MSPVSIFAAILVLAVATRPATSQMEECASGISECSNSLMGQLSGGALPEGGYCGLMQGFMDCIKRLSCPMSKEQLDAIIENAMAPLAAQGIKCDIKTDGTGSATGSGSQGGMGASGGMEMDMSGMSQECAAAMAKCTKEYTDSMQGEMAGGVCSVLKKYTDCVGGLPCGMDENTKEQMVAQIYTPLQKEGIQCDPKTGTMIHTSGGAGGAGAGTNGLIGLFFKLQEKFSKHKCGAVPQNCSKKHGGDSPDKPSCDEVKKTAQCMFAECPAIQGTDDGTESADLLVKFAKSVECTFTASELQNNGSPAIVTGSVLVLMLSALVTMFFV